MIPDALFDEWRKVGKVSRIQARGSSMGGSVPTGATLVVEHMGPEALEVGDIIVFRIGGTLVVHRLIGKKREGEKTVLLEKGDRGLEAHEIPEEWLLGRVRDILVDGRSVSMAEGIGKGLNRLIGQYFRLGQAAAVMIAGVRENAPWIYSSTFLRLSAGAARNMAAALPRLWVRIGYSVIGRKGE